MLDDKIKADPALAADCLAEGRKWIDKNAAEAAASRKQDPQCLPGRRLDLRAQIRRPLRGRRTAMSASSGPTTWTPAAPIPTRDVNTILWDATAKKRISIRPFFTETADNGPTMTAMLQSRDRRR